MEIRKRDVVDTNNHHSSSSLEPSSYAGGHHDEGDDGHGGGGRANGTVPPPEDQQGQGPLSESEEEEETTSTEPSTQVALIVLLVVFLGSIGALALVYANFPQLEESERINMKLPRNIEDAKIVGGILSRYKDRYFYEVLSAVFLTYIFLQTFAIPGSIFLSIMSGFLFSFPVALFLICFCSATGASFCYILSFLVGKRLIYKYFPSRAREWALIVESHRDYLLNYIIFLRITPFLPNWFINITAPVVGFPFTTFWIGTFLGVAPPSFVAIQAGTTLHKLTSSGDCVSWTSLLVLLALGLGSLVPVIFKNSIKSKYE